MTSGFLSGCQRVDFVADAIHHETAEEVVDKVYQQEERVGPRLLEQDAQDRVFECRIRSDVEKVELRSGIGIDEDYVQDNCDCDGHDPEDVTVDQGPETLLCQKAVGNHGIDAACDHKGVPEDGLDGYGHICSGQCRCRLHEVEECGCEALERDISDECLLELAFLHEIDERKQVHRD